jgi:hypothetical protein
MQALMHPSPSLQSTPCCGLLLLLALLQASGKRPKVEGSKDDIFGQETGVQTPLLQSSVTE